MNRSTYAAELNGLADGLEPAKVIALMLVEIINGACTAGSLKAALEEANWPLPVECAVDANAVFESITAKEARLPLEESLIAILMAVREQFAVGMISKIWWVSTVDMLADALTKGAIAREPLLRALADGYWTITQATKCGTVRPDAVPFRDVSGDSNKCAAIEAAV